MRAAARIPPQLLLATNALQFLLGSNALRLLRATNAAQLPPGRRGRVVAPPGRDDRAGGRAAEALGAERGAETDGRLAPPRGALRACGARLGAERAEGALLGAIRGDEGLRLGAACGCERPEGAARGRSRGARSGVDRAEGALLGDTRAEGRLAAGARSGVDRAEGALLGDTRAEGRLAAGTRSGVDRAEGALLGDTRAEGRLAAGARSGVDRADGVLLGDTRAEGRLAAGGRVVRPADGLPRSALGVLVLTPEDASGPVLTVPIRSVPPAARSDGRAARAVLLPAAAPRLVVALGAVPRLVVALGAVPRAAARSVAGLRVGRAARSEEPVGRSVVVLPETDAGVTTLDLRCAVREVMPRGLSLYVAPARARGEGR